MDEAEETVLLSFSFSEKKACAAGAATSSASGESGTSKDSAVHKTKKTTRYSI